MTLIRVLLFSIVFAGTSSQKGANATAKAAGPDWNQYTDSLVRFSYPPAFVLHQLDLPGGKHCWQVGSPAAFWKEFRACAFPMSAERRSLDQIVAQEMKKKVTFVSGPNKVNPPGGQCIKYRTESWMYFCGNLGSIGSATTTKPRCIAATTHVVCNDREQNLSFEMDSALSVYTDWNAPDDAAVQASAMFDSIFDTFGFNKRIGPEPQAPTRKTKKTQE